ncbi:ABC transporter permease subunit [Microlunatus parietis]|uniref:ABC-type proline/glycine betaine transport system permease subunit n=1 Tax=Microlunatus parietis TaxID=682979 RepID=A0A7Y9I9D9_9ACTN|nr:ABC transporter permease subunit [Microlunatus parietis]NYE72680.1 ABC-type proline/glycine betaine transport system permease subunit [Microlunatus parietis]
MNLTGYLFDAANWTWSSPLLIALAVHALSTLVLLVVGGLLGLGLGCLFGAFRGSRPVVRLVSWLGTGVPVLGLLAVGVIIFGAGLPVLAGCLLLLIMLSVAGVTARELRAGDPAVIESGRAMGLSRAGLFFGYRIPLVLPPVLRTLARVGAGTVTALAVAGMIGAPGLGGVIKTGFDSGYPQVFAGAVLLIGLGWLFYLTFAGLGWAARRRVA